MIAAQVVVRSVVTVCNAARDARVQMLLGRKDYTMKTYTALMAAVKEALGSLNGGASVKHEVHAPGTDRRHKSLETVTAGAKATGTSATGTDAADGSTPTARWTAERLEMAAWSRAMLPEVPDTEEGPAPKRAKR